MKSYNLEYWVGKKHISTIIYSKPKQLVSGMKNKLKNTDSRYKLGEFKIKPN